MALPFSNSVISPSIAAADLAAARTSALGSLRASIKGGTADGLPRSPRTWAAAARVETLSELRRASTSLWDPNLFKAPAAAD